LSVSVMGVHYVLDPNPVSEADPRHRTFISAGAYKSPFNINNRIYSNQGEPSTAGVHRVSNFDPRANRRPTLGYIDRWTYLRPVKEYLHKGVGRGGYAPFYQRGTVRIESRTYAGVPSGNVRITTKDLPESAAIRSYFEGWLVDDDTGYRLYLGAFTTLKFGTGELRYKASTYFDVYDRVEITAKSFHDPTFGPGEVVLQAYIDAPKRFNPPPKSSLLISGPFENY